MEKTGMIMKQDHHRIRMVYEPELLDALFMHLDDPVDPPVFCFFGFSLDPTFFNYTEAVDRGSETVLFFSTRSENKDPYCLSKSEQVSKEDLVSAATPQIFSAMADNSFPVRPHFILVVSPDRGVIFDDRQQALRPRFHVRFPARKTVWQYIVSGKKRGSLTILDREGKTIFKKSDPAALEMNRAEQSFISDRALPFCKIAPHHFSLRDEISGKILIKRLPAASPDILCRADKTEPNTYMSQIFINI